MNVRKALFVVKLALLLVLALTIAKTVGALWQPIGVAEPLLSVDANGMGVFLDTKPIAFEPEKYAAILRRNIFSGLDSSSAMNASLSDDNVAAMMQSAEQELGLVLTGTLAGNPAISTAIIKDVKSNVSKICKVGDIVAGARVSSIRKTMVILLHGGQNKMLRLHPDELADGSTDYAPVELPQEDGETAEPIDTGRINEIPVVRSSPLLGHFERMLETATIKPYSVNGRVEGLKVTGLENIPIISDIGIKNGDVICRVNGHSLTDKRMAFQIFQKARTQPSLDIELLREDKERKISFSLQ